MRLALLLHILLLSLSTGAQTSRVTHVSDGDSFIIESGERVRMIGMNAPELADRFGRESKDHLSRLILGKTVTLERDPQNDDRDVHGRLLRFVVADGTDINHRMIADGYAYAFLRYPFARARRDAHREAEAAAKASGLGVWAADHRTTPDADTSPPQPDSTRTHWCLPGLFLVLLGLHNCYRSRAGLRT